MTLEEIKQIISNARTGVYDSSYKIEAIASMYLLIKSINNNISIEISCRERISYKKDIKESKFLKKNTDPEIIKQWFIDYNISQKYAESPHIECSKEDYDNIKSFITELYHQQQEIAEINAKSAFLV